MTFEKWLLEASSYYIKNKDEQRRGQAYWNFLMETRIDLTNNMLGTRLDPFYDDRRLEDFLEYVKKNW